MSRRRPFICSLIRSPASGARQDGSSALVAQSASLTWMARNQVLEPSPTASQSIHQYKAGIRGRARTWTQALWHSILVSQWFLNHCAKHPALFPSFKETSKLFPKVIAPFCIPIKNESEFQLLCIFTNMWYCQQLPVFEKKNRYSNGYVVISHNGLKLCFLTAHELSLLSCVYLPPIISSLMRCLVKSFGKKIKRKGWVVFWLLSLEATLHSGDSPLLDL